MAEEAVHDQSSEEVGNDQQSGPPRRRPEIKELIDEENRNEESQRKPLVAQSPGPIAHWLEEFAGEVTDQHERAGQAKEITRN